MGQPLPPAVPKAELAADYLVLPCALVRGALAQLGLEASVSADATSLPQVDFTVVVRQPQQQPAPTHQQQQQQR